jgi:hypothetical protein
MWGPLSWRSRMPSSAERLTLSPPTNPKPGTGPLSVLSFPKNTRSLSNQCVGDLTSEYPKSNRPSRHPMALQFKHSTIISEPSQIRNSRKGDTWALSPIPKLNPSSDLFNLPPSASFPRPATSTPIVWSKIYPSHMSLLVRIIPSIARSPQTTIQPHGGRSTQWHSSSPTSPQALKLQSGMLPKHTEPSPSFRTNGQALWSGCFNPDSFGIDTAGCFGLASASGVYGQVADAGSDIFRMSGIGPLSKWVDDHIFFRIPCQHLENYNLYHRRACHTIQQTGGRLHDGGRLWFKGGKTPDGRVEEFDEDASAPIRDLSHTSPRSPEDSPFTYCIADIHLMLAG